MFDLSKISLSFMLVVFYFLYAAVIFWVAIDFASARDGSEKK
jgi:hypothetical protein